MSLSTRTATLGRSRSRSQLHADPARSDGRAAATAYRSGDTVSLRHHSENRSARADRRYSPDAARRGGKRNWRTLESPERALAVRHYRCADALACGLDLPLHQAVVLSAGRELAANGIADDPRAGRLHPARRRGILPEAGRDYNRAPR